MDAKQSQASEVGRALVEELAPDELPLYEPIRDAYFADPSRVQTTARDEFMGMGGDVAALITPAALSAAMHVISFLSIEVAKCMVKPTAELIAEQIKKLFRREPAVLKLDPEQLARIRSIVVEIAVQLKVQQAEAMLLGDAMVGRLTAAARG